MSRPEPTKSKDSGAVVAAFSAIFSVSDRIMMGESKRSNSSKSAKSRSKNVSGSWTSTKNILFILDVGGMILILFGQWLYDPNTLVAPDDVFDRWVCEESFFAQFSLRFASDQGVAFELKVESPALVPAERLRHPVQFKSLRECRLIAGSSQSLVRDLENAQVIHPVES